MSQADIEFVYFDLGNVLVAFDPAIACANVARRFGVPPAEAQAVIYDSGLQDRFEHGQVNGDEFAETVRTALKRSATEMPTPALLDATSDMFTPIESMEAIIRSVAAGGRRVGILSNTCHAHWDWIGRQDWAAIKFPFEVQILSCDVGAMKPDPRIYQAAERAAGVSPQSILFLDDKAENVAGAIARSWQAIQCVGGPEARDALQRCGVLA